MPANVEGPEGRERRGSSVRARAAAGQRVAHEEGGEDSPVGVTATGRPAGSVEWRMKKGNIPKSMRFSILFNAGGGEINCSCSNVNPLSPNNFIPDRQTRPPGRGAPGPVGVAEGILSAGSRAAAQSTLREE